MKQNNDGFSLVEILVAILILGMFFATACSALVLGHRLNLKNEATLQAQLAVSSAVETLMAEGISSADNINEEYDLTDEVDIEGNPIDRFPEVKVKVERVTEGVGDDTVVHPYFKVTVTSETSDITVMTHIREKAVTEP